MPGSSPATTFYFDADVFLVHIESMSDEADVQIESDDPEVAEKAEHKVKKLRDEIEALRKEKQEYLDGWQRAKADYVNALKRFEADVKSSKAEGVVKAIEALLPAYDALERAKEHGEVPEGFLAIAKQLESGMRGLGLEAVGQVGEVFNPILHEALGRDVTDAAQNDDTVTAVLEKGLRMGDQIIRPAKVRVAHFG